MRDSTACALKNLENSKDRGHFTCKPARTKQDFKMCQGLPVPVDYPDYMHGGHSDTTIDEESPLNGTGIEPPSTGDAGEEEEMPVEENGKDEEEEEEEEEQKEKKKASDKEKRAQEEMQLPETVDLKSIPTTTATATVSTIPPTNVKEKIEFYENLGK